MWEEVDLQVLLSKIGKWKWEGGREEGKEKRRIFLQLSNPKCRRNQMFHGELDSPSEAERVNKPVLNSGVSGEGTNTNCKWPMCKLFDTPPFMKSLAQNET